jgi:N-acetyl-anhydromuramyl-L-alanine amidase AmpD
MDSNLRENLYTLRWLAKQLTPAARDQSLELIGLMLGENHTAIMETKPLGIGEKLLRVPFAKQYNKPSRTRGEYAHGYPVGAIVHFTAGHDTQTLEEAMDEQIKNGYTYFFIDKDGNIVQNFPLNEWGYHCGESKWPGLGSSCHSKLVGIEVACAGQLESNGAPWFSKSKTPLPADQIRKVPGLDNMEEGLYQKYTREQEEALTKLILWLYHNNPNVFNLDYVLGHDEVSGPKGLGWRRKNDPGGSLSSTMTQFRDKLKTLAAQ